MLRGVLLVTNKIREDINKVKHQIVNIMGEYCDEEIKKCCIFDEISRLYFIREGYQGRTYEGKHCQDILKSIKKFIYHL